MNHPLLDRLEAKIRNGEPMTYEDAADLFEHTIVGQAAIRSSGLTRAGILALMRKRFPTTEELTMNIRAYLKAYDEMNGDRGLH